MCKKPGRSAGAINKQEKSEESLPSVDLGHPTPAHGRIPAFRSIEEEAEFWDTHSFVDYLDHFEPMESPPEQSVEGAVPQYDFGYPTPARGKIPAFHNIEEEAEFWDTHDITDLKDQLEPLFPTTKTSKPEVIVVPLSEAASTELARIAEKRGLPSDTLVRMWVEERLDQERKAS